jgi:hypothetical protein
MPAVDLDGLGVLPADVEHGARAGELLVRAEPVAQDLGADVLLGERQALPAVAGADGAAVDELDGAARAARPPVRASAARPRSPLGGPPACWSSNPSSPQLVLDADDGLVEDAHEVVEGHVGVGVGLRQAAVLSWPRGRGRSPRSSSPLQELERRSGWPPHAIMCSTIAATRRGAPRMRATRGCAHSSRTPSASTRSCARTAAGAARSGTRGRIFSRTAAPGSPSRARDRAGEAGADVHLGLGDRGREIVVAAAVGDAATEDGCPSRRASPPWWWWTPGRCR